jgi:hypothetical protein
MYYRLGPISAELKDSGVYRAQESIPRNEFCQPM